MDYLEHLDINLIRNDLKKEHKLDIDCDEKVALRLLKGISFKNHEVKVDIQEYYNHLAGRVCQHFYFICPKCLKRCRKVYVNSDDSLACRKCSNIKYKVRVGTQADRVIRIQVYLRELCDKNISAKKRKKLIRDITGHYQELNDRYKMMYNTIAFKELQKWCLNSFQDKTKSDEYRKASKDMLAILRDIRKVLVFSGLSISKNSKLKI